MQIMRILDEFRELGEYAEMSLYSANGRIIASSIDTSGALVPDSPDKYILARVSRGVEFSRMEPMSDGALQLRVVVPLPSEGVIDTGRYLQVLYPLPLRLFQARGQHPDRIGGIPQAAIPADSIEAQLRRHPLA
jgi:hypothetical protein